MDIGLREWLIVIGLIVIAGISSSTVGGGWGGKGKLKFKLDRSFANLPDDDGDSAELLGPAGGRAPRAILRRTGPAQRQRPRSQGAQRAASARKSRARAIWTSTRGWPWRRTRAMPPSRWSHARASRRGARRKSGESPCGRCRTCPVDEVLIINVIARDESGFKGPALLQNILESGLRFGDMDIFHRHESMAGNGEILFSMANAVKPGTFDLDDIDNFSTRAVSFFLGLPGPRHPKQAFDVMVAAARKLAHELNGELKDEQRSVLTAQTIEHYRQRIIDHERRSLMQKR